MVSCHRKGHRCRGSGGVKFRSGRFAEMFLGEYLSDVITLRVLTGVVYAR